MTRYIVSRLIGMMGVLIAVSALTFFLMHSIPGGPFDAQALAASQMIPEEIKAVIDAKYGFDKPVIEQYFTFVKNALRLDFGYSFFSTGRTVKDIFRDHWPFTLRLGLYTFIFSIIVGGGLGIAAAMKSGTWVDYLGSGVAIFCLATPSFVLAVVLQYIFAVRWNIVSISGTDKFIQWILPTICNSLGPILILQRYVRSSVADVMNSNYVRTARAKGMSEFRVTFVHVLKNALTPVVTVLGPMMAGFLIGSFFIEKIFVIPGIGRFFVMALQNRDYPLIMANTMLWTVIISATLFITDIVYVLIDPRVSLVKER